MLQAWQAYHRYRLTYDSEWNGAIDEVWEKYRSDWLAKNPRVKPPKKRFEMANEFIKETYMTETPEKVAEVDEYRKKLKEEKASLVNTENMQYQG
jgi:hypothetical protein